MVRFTFITLVLLSFSFSLPSKTFAHTQSEADERSEEIEKLETEIQKIKEEQQKQIEELQKRIEELEAETKWEKEKEFVEPSKPPREVEEAPAKTYVIEWWKNIELGYSNGFFIRTQDDLFSLKFNIRSQFLFFVEDEGGDTATSFDIRRLWISFKGSAFRPWFKFLFHKESQLKASVWLLIY